MAFCQCQSCQLLVQERSAGQPVSFGVHVGLNNKTTPSLLLPRHRTWTCAHRKIVTVSANMCVFLHRCVCDWLYKRYGPAASLPWGHHDQFLAQRADEVDVRENEMDVYCVLLFTVVRLERSNRWCGGSQGCNHWFMDIYRALRSTRRFILTPSSYTYLLRNMIWAMIRGCESFKSKFEPLHQEAHAKKEFKSDMECLHGNSISITYLYTTKSFIQVYTKDTASWMMLKV